MTALNTNRSDTLVESRIEMLAQLSDVYSQFMQVQRATFREGRPETDGEHTLHAMFLAVAYTAQYHPEFDPGEVALLMMVHNLDEVYAGDVNSLMADDRDMHQKEMDELRDRARLRQDLAAAPFIVALLERYWAQQEPVARYVRAIEKLDPSFSHTRDGGTAIRAMGITTRQQYHVLDTRAVNRMADYAPADVVHMRRLLSDRVAAAAFDTV